MSNPSIFFAAMFAAAIVFPMPVKAQESKPNERISFRVLCIEARDEVASVLPPKGNPADLVVPLYVGNFTDLITAKFADRKAAFFIEDKQADGNAGRKLVAEGPLATGARQVFVFVPSKEKTGPAYRIIAFDDSNGAFAMGSTRVLNLTPFPVRLNVAGTEQKPIKAAESAVYPLCKKVDEWNMYSVGIDLEVQPQQWQSIAVQSWKASDKKRDWAIINFDEATKQPGIRLYQDIPPWTTVDLSTKGQKPRK